MGNKFPYRVKHDRNLEITVNFSKQYRFIPNLGMRCFYLRAKNLSPILVPTNNRIFD